MAKRKPLEDLGQARAGRQQHGRRKAQNNNTKGVNERPRQTPKKAPDGDDLKPLPLPPCRGPAPDMRALHSPVELGWDRLKWTRWFVQEDDRQAFVRWRSLYEDDDYESDEELCDDADSGSRLVQCSKRQQAAAVRWAAPDEILMKAFRVLGSTSEQGGGAGRELIGELEVSADCQDTIRTVIESLCSGKGLEPHLFTWSFKGARKDGPQDILLERDRLALDYLWDPSNARRWARNSCYGTQELVATPKAPPGLPPAQPPSFGGLLYPPPEAGAPSMSWKAWYHAHSEDDDGLSSFREEMRGAVAWRCPSRLKLRLYGIWHFWDVEIGADETLDAAAAAFCKAAPAKAQPLSPADILLYRAHDPLKNGSHGEFLDLQNTTGRDVYRCTEAGGHLRMQVIHRDEKRENREQKAWLADQEESWSVAWTGARVLLDDDEPSWQVSEEGIDLYNRVICEAMNVFRVQDFDSWQEMLKKIKAILKETVRSPRNGFTLSRALAAVDGMTAILLATAYRQEWQQTYLGPENWSLWFRGEDETRALIKKIGADTAKLVAALQRTAESCYPYTVDPPKGGLRIQESLDQLRRLLPKLSMAYSGHFRWRSPPMSKALALLAEPE